MAEMEIDTGDDVLRKAALDGSMDYSLWPELLPTVLSRIEKIAHTEFPIPNIPPPAQPARPPSPRFLAPLPSSDPFDAPDQTETSSSQGTNKENADPSLPSAAAGAGASTNVASAAVVGPGTPAQQPTPTASLPKPIADMLDEIISVLRTSFPQYPPHTIQRLSELILRPRQHYRHLVPYLHALDRVVHVTSGANTYPLPPALPDVGAMSLLANGAGSGSTGNLSIDTAAANSLGSDEALGGALLTPIPWLSRRSNGSGSEDGSEAGGSSPLSAGENPERQFQAQQQQQRPGGHIEGRVRTESTETIEGPNGIGSIETVSVSVNGIPSTGAGVALLTQRSVTQGELLRQEQRAGLVPLNQINRQQQSPQQQTQGDSDATAQEDATMGEGADKEEEETPHVRGPEEIGAADMGPQSAATANYIASGGSPMDVQGLDVEAAVGRRVQSPPAQQQQDGDNKPASDSREGSEPAPKREAGDDLEPESPTTKRRKDDDEPGAQENKDQNTTTTTTEQKPADGNAAPSEPKRDAEGDVVLPDAGAAEAGNEGGAAADPEKGRPVDGTKGDDEKDTAGSGEGGSVVTKQDEAAKDQAGG
ncbi:uncharacterized protein B0H64DRAFT_437161 [Chaetomium fimeti]|uniref:Protein phosphatase 4 core regulatory subunit R2 n=1 Tax=Chaetomium fimeti TaxID=1854472 RepID=A0AAE0HNR5_9PEZI|nr:hypothetical protein B0H64DRAFT_437161 [Chaetomium fimeti]